MEATEPTRHRRRSADFFALPGVVVGVVVVFTAWGIDAYVHGTGYVLGALGKIHQEDPLLWMIDLAPLALGWMWSTRERLERLLIEREELKRDAAGRVLLEVLVDAVVDGIILVDPSGRVVEVNQAAERLFGTSATLLRGRELRTILPEHHLLKAERRHLERSTRGEVLGVVWQMPAIHTDGTPFNVRVGIASYQGADGRVTLYVVRDDAKERAHQAEIRTNAVERARSRARQATQVALIEEALRLCVLDVQPSPRVTVLRAMASAFVASSAPSGGTRLSPMLAGFAGARVAVSPAPSLPVVAAGGNELGALLQLVAMELRHGDAVKIGASQAVYEGRAWVSLSVTRAGLVFDPALELPSIERLVEEQAHLASWSDLSLWLAAIQLRVGALQGAVSMAVAGGELRLVLRLPVAQGE